MAKRAAREGQSPTKRTRPKRQAATAETMAARQREISVSEFFAKNRHLLGFDNPRKALLTSVKEAVDNALDACEEAGILPDIHVAIDELAPPKSPSSPTRYRVTVEDNGPGIVRKQIDNIFGRLLYGSKFHRLKMSRGQQGIGISAAGMYGLMTTGRPMVIVTRPKKGKPAHHIELAMDTTRNKPVVSTDVETDDFPENTGTRVAIELEARYTRGRTSVDEYLEQTAIANPHARITYNPPTSSANGQNAEPQLLPENSEPQVSPDADDALSAHATHTTLPDGTLVFPRTIDELPEEPEEIKPHPRGVELGTLMQMLKQTGEKNLAGFLKNDLCRVTPTVANEIYKRTGLTARTRVSGIGHAESEKLYKAFQEVTLRAPPTNCLSPIGVRQILAGLLKGVRAEFYTASTRPPAVYRGNPFQIEVGLAFGGDLEPEAEDQTQARVIRFANRVPLLYQQSACSSFKAVLETSWRNYGLSQPRGSLPQAPLIVMIHMASVWVPFTSESKEAIADYDEIRKEMRLALQECGRKLATYVRKRQKMKREGEKRGVFERYIGEVVRACSAVTGAEPQRLYDALLEQARRKTAIADQVLDDEGRIVKRGGDEEPPPGEDTIIIPDSSPPPEAPGPANAQDNEPSPPKPSKRRAPRAARKPRASRSTPTKRRTKKSAARSRSGAASNGRAANAPKPRVRINLVPAPSGEQTLFG